MNIRVAVGDETLHTIQAPAVVFFIESGFEHHALEVGTCIRFGQVHRHGFASRNARNVFLALFFATKFVESVDTALEAPHILETSVGS